MSDTLTVNGLGQLLASVPPFEPALALELFRREQAAQGRAIPRLAAIAVEEAAPARAQLAAYRSEVKEMAKKLYALQPIAPAVDLPEFGL